MVMKKTVMMTTTTMTIFEAVRGAGEVAAAAAPAVDVGGKGAGRAADRVLAAASQRK